MEISDINNAISRYRQALDNLREYERLVVERGVVAELSSGLKIGDLMILDRLTLCLVRSDHCSQACAEAERYFEEFPRARNTAAGKRILKRVLPRDSDKGTDNKASNSSANMRGAVGGSGICRADSWRKVETCNVPEIITEVVTKRVNFYDEVQDKQNRPRHSGHRTNPPRVLHSAISPR